jgi:hypothetical protein
MERDTVSNTTAAPPADVLESIRAIVAYDLPTEQADYERQHPDDREGHVFGHLERVSAWLKDAEAQRTAFVQVVNVEERTDGYYVFADLDDARAFEATVNASDPPTFVVSRCYRTEEVVCDHADALKLIAAECEASAEAEVASLESGVPVTTHAWKRGEDAPYPEKLETVEYTVYPTGGGDGPHKIVLWVGLNPDNGSVNVDAGRERLESEGWEVTDWGAA